MEKLPEARLADQLIVYMFPVIDQHKVNNLIAFIREKDQPVLFGEPRGLFTMKHSGQPAPDMERIFLEPGEFLAEFGNEFLIARTFTKLSRNVSVRLMTQAIRHSR
jgi:hypothetical protein